MRILFVVHDFLPRHRAGTEIYTFNAAATLNRRHLVAVFTTEFRPFEQPYKMREKMVAGVRVFEASADRSHPSFADTYSNRRMEQAFHDLLSLFRPDVVHIQHLQNHSLRYPQIARRHGAAVVYTLNDYFLLCGHPLGGQMLDESLRICAEPDPGRCAACIGSAAYGLGRMEALALRLARRLPAPEALFGALQRAGAVGSTARRWLRRRRFVSALEPRLVAERMGMAQEASRYVNVFISPSKFVAETHRRMGIGGRNLTHLPYGFNPRGFERRPARARRSPRFGFVGTVAPHKGLHVLLDAVKLCGMEAAIEVFGNTSAFPSYSAPLMRRAAMLPVRFHGEFEPAKAPQVYRQFDVLVVPSIWQENSPLTIHEAFMSGLPVVAAAAGGVPELVKDGGNGLLFEIGNSSELARCLSSLLHNGDLLARLAANVPQVKDIAAHCRELAQIYLSPTR